MMMRTNNNNTNNNYYGRTIPWTLALSCISPLIVWILVVIDQTNPIPQTWEIVSQVTTMVTPKMQWKKYPLLFQEAGVSSTEFQKPQNPRSLSGTDVGILNDTVTSLSSSSKEDEDELAILQERFSKPHTFQINGDALIPHQFVHMHNMKTAGTSLDHMMKCAMERMRQDFHLEVPYYALHECSRGEYRRCKAGEEPPCTSKMAESAILSLCGPIHDLPYFGWDPAHPLPRKFRSVTILRHPVDRVWSMFKFETRLCYQCKPLTELYKQLDSGNRDPRVDQLCWRHMQNKETENLLTTTWMNDTATDDEKVAEAIANMKRFHTLIGLTEQMDATRKMLGQVFPWMNETLQGSNTACPLPHDNSSPKNNHCGPDFTHWDLPKHPDEETKAAIIAHNQLDLKVYEAAVKQFELQKKALGINNDDA